MIKISRALLGFLFIFSVSYAQSATFNFGCIGDPDPNFSGCDSDVAPLLTLNVTDSGPDTLFRFDVGSGANASITGVYFDDADPRLISSPTSSSYTYGGTTAGGGVLFDDVEEPGANFPGGQNVGFESDFSASAKPPAGDDKNGIDNGEWLGILFQATDFDAIVSAIRTGAMRIGVHVQSIGPCPDPTDEENCFGLSDSALTVVPIPAAAILFGSALLGFAGFATRRRVS